MDEERDGRMAALRSRVKERLGAQREANRQEEELVVDDSELMVIDQVAEVEAETDWLAMQDRDVDRWRNMAAALMLVGSVLGIISGALILQGNPSELLSTSLFEDQDSVSITGLVLLDDDGHGMANVTVELKDVDSEALLQTTQTNQDGYFSFENMANEAHLLVVSEEGYTTVKRTFTPDRVELRPVTMKTGEGETVESEGTISDGWTLDNAVGLSSVIGFLTILTAFAGVQAAIETRRGLHYRRSQYLAGVALLSRGLIVIGPTLLLAGMVINVLAREDYNDMRED